MNKKSMFAWAIALSALFFAGCEEEQKKTQSQDELDILISEMSLEEKIGQMTNLTLATIAHENEEGKIILDTAKLINAVDSHHIGSFQNVISHAYHLEEWHSLLTTIQSTTLKYQNIPSLYCIDAIHGMNFTMGSTIFPHNIGMAATRNPELVKLVSGITAKECRATGIRYNFDPVLDVGREQQWSRFGETYGEDTYLVQEMGVTAIKAYEGEDKTLPAHVASCMKHFVGYGVPNNGRDRAPASIPDVELREYFLPPFQKAIDAKASTIMINSGEVNGVPVHASKYLLTDLLRTEMGYKGVIISDWQDILKLHERHRVAATHQEAVLLAIDAGIDMVIVPFDYAFYDDLITLVKAGKISESRIDASVKRILQLKKDVGLFDTPHIEEEAIKNFGLAEYKDAALKAAQESITLLKNENNILPLVNADANIALMGPNAHSITSLHGAWTYTWQGTDSSYFSKETLTISEALSKDFKNLKLIEGISYSQNKIPTADLLNQTKNSNIVIYCIGEESYAETPGNIPSLELDPIHLQNIKSLHEKGKKIVLILTEGRPRIIREIEPYCEAIVQAYLPGSQGAQAITDVLKGKINPSGKLPYTYPRYAGERITYDHKALDEAVEIVVPEYSFSYKFTPQYEFGHGLSYTTFEYGNIELNDSVISDSLLVKVKISNTGDRSGKHTVELYTRDLFASITPNVKRLKKFQKIELKAGESKEVSFLITKSDLAFVHQDKSKKADNGTFEIMLGDKSISFELKE